METQEREWNSRSFLFRTNDNSLFLVETDGDRLEDIVSVAWRGVSLCAECFLERLDAQEKEGLLERLRGDVRTV